MTAGRVLGGRYRLDRLLATGGMGTVWQGRDLRLDRAVAVKELTGGALTLPMAVERFDREARAVARLAHPNIVAVHDTGVADGRPYLVMELVEGRSVAAILKDGPMAPASAVAIAAQTCDGLAAAHAAGIIHRDIKPANLLVAGTGVVKICDFGIARLLDTTSDSTLTGALPPLGSYKYVAPEQATGGPVDARTDLYAFGCTLYAMLAGQPPFTGDQRTVLHLHLTQPPPPLPASRGDIPPGLDALVQQLLRKDPEERPLDAVVVKTRLVALADDLAAGGVPVPEIRPSAVPTAAATAAAGAIPPTPSAARPVSPTGVSRVRRWSLAVAGAAVVAVTVLGALALATWWPKANVADAGAPPAPPSTSSSAGTAPQSVAAAPRAQPTTTNRSLRDKRAAPPTPASVSRTTRPPSSSATPADPVVAMRLSIKREVDAGHLNPTKAPDLYKKVDDIAHASNDGHVDEAAKKVGELRNKLTELHDSGTLTSAGYDRLNIDLDRLAASVP